MHAARTLCAHQRRRRFLPSPPSLPSSRHHQQRNEGTSGGVRSRRSLQPLPSSSRACSLARLLASLPAASLSPPFLLSRHSSLPSAPPSPPPLSPVASPLLHARLSGARQSVSRQRTKELTGELRSLSLPVRLSVSKCCCCCCRRGRVGRPGRDTGCAHRGVILFGEQTDEPTDGRTDNEGVTADGARGREGGERCLRRRRLWRLSRPRPLLVLASRLKQATNYASFSERKERAKSSSSSSIV